MKQLKFMGSSLDDLRNFPKWEEFSLEMLLTLATRAGMRITLKKAA